MSVLTTITAEQYSEISRVAKIERDIYREREGLDFAFQLWNFIFIRVLPLAAFAS